MGISDDIKPKKTYRYVGKTETSIPVSHPSKSETATPKRHDHNHSEPTKDSTNQLEDKASLEDDFFNDQSRHHHPQQHQHLNPKNTVQTKSSHFTRKILWLLVFIILGFVIYKNIDQIKQSLLHKLSEKVGIQEETVTYVNVAKENSTSENKSSTTTSPSETKTEAPEEKPVSTANTVNKASIKLEVLNGNGISGSADKMADILTAAGYTVEKVANAKKFTYTTTTIYYKTGKDKEAATIQSSLAGKYNAETLLSDTLTAGYDVVVVVGKN